MKCDELKATTAQEIVRNEKDCDYMDKLFGGVKMPPTQVYFKSDVDAAIDELKAEINRKEGVGQRWFERCMEARTENVKLKRALWLSKAERAKEFRYKIRFAISSMNTKYNYSDADKWEKIERKCRAKAEEYK